MATSLTVTLVRPVGFPFQPLDKGQDIAELQQALMVLKLNIDERELKAQFFGRSTRSAINTFQTQQSLTVTGRVDEATAKRLNQVLEERKLFTAKNRPFRDRRFLRLKPIEIGQMDREAMSFVQQRLNQEFKETIIRQFHSPSEALQSAVREMALNYAKFADQTMERALVEQIIPALMDRSELSEELELQLDQVIFDDDALVSEVLQLNLDMRRHPFFTDEARRSKNASLAAIVGLQGNQIEAIEDYDLDSVSAETWDNLVKRRVLTQKVRADLENTIQFARLTDDHFETIEALRSEKRQTTRDLIELDKRDWQSLLVRNKVMPPEGEDLVSYAELLNINVQRTFRTPYLMERLVTRKQDAVISRTADLEVLKKRNAVIFHDGGVSDTLDFGGIQPADRKRVEASLAELASFANTYRHLGVKEILNDRKLSAAQKQTALRAKQNALQAFQRNNLDLDLDWAQFFDFGHPVSQAFQPNWEAIGDDDKPLVRRTFMAFQRVHRLTESFDESEALLAAGLDSAVAITTLSERNFIKRIALPEGDARRIYRKAGDNAIKAAHALAVIEESTNHGRLLPSVLKGTELPNLELINVLKDIDGYQDLFGSQNFCRCKHCRSIFSPAAYLVDLLDFIHEHISKPTFIDGQKTTHPLYLKNRRPDLWALILNCVNTDTPIPYLTIVNEVLQTYLQQVFEEQDIFEALTSANLSFNQPFNLAHETLKLYLSHFRVTLPELYELFALPAKEIARARFGCSPEVFATISQPDTNDILFRYDLVSTESLLDVAAIIRRIGISRQEFDRLLKLEFIRGGLTIEINSNSPNNDLVGFREQLSVAHSGTRLALAANDIFIRHWLDRLHRFRRLWGILPWTPEELHLILTTLIDPHLFIKETFRNSPQRTAALGEALDETILIQISNLLWIQDQSDLPVDELCALLDVLPRVASSAEHPSLFARLFGEAQTLSIRHPLLTQNEDIIPEISLDFGVLQGALRLSEVQLLELINENLPGSVIATGLFDFNHLSVLYRESRLARLLGTEPSSLNKVRNLLDLAEPTSKASDRIAGLMSMLHFKTNLEEAPFTIDEAWWVIQGTASGSVGSRVGQAEVDVLLEKIRDDKALEFTADALLGVAELTPDISQRLLNVLSIDPANWLVEVDTEESRSYRIASAFGVTPNLQPVVSFLLDNGGIPATVQQRAEQIVLHLRRYHPVTSLIYRLCERFNVNESYLIALEPFLRMSWFDEALVSQLFAWLELENSSDKAAVLDLLLDLERMLFLFKEKLDLPINALGFIVERTSFFSLTLPTGISWNSLRLLSLYANIRHSLKERGGELDILLTAAGNNGTFPLESWSQLALILAADVSTLQSLIPNLSMPPQPLEALLKVRSATKLSKKLGLNGAALKQLTATEYFGLRIGTELLYGAIRAKYDDETEWKKVIDPYIDRINMLKRDILVDRILSKEFQLKFKDTREIYQFFLLDVEMDGCARISRVLEAISACQLYVHRCLMNLEQSELGDVRVVPDGDVQEQWPWRKNYRVWEANRKVFLYPENWLEPDLRDNKTPIFRQVESELLQSTITPDSIEKIYRYYIRDYSQVASLIVVSTIYDADENTYLFFARTPDNPYRYFWRKFLRKVEWTPWESIDLDIEARTVSAHKHKGKLYLFWLTVLTNRDKDQSISGQRRIEDDQTVYLQYTTLETVGRWSTPQRKAFHNIRVTQFDKKLSSDFKNLDDVAVNPNDDPKKLGNISKTPLEAANRYYKVYVHSAPGDDRIRVFHYYSPEKEVVAAHLNEYTGAMERVNSLFWSPNLPLIPAFTWANGLKIRLAGTQAKVVVSTEYEADFYGEVAYENSLRQMASLAAINGVLQVTNYFPRGIRAELGVIHNQVGEFILSIGDQQFLVLKTGGSGYGPDKNFANLLEAAVAYSKRKRDTIRLSTSIADELGQVLYDEGVESFLSLKTQRITEKPVKHVNFEWLAELPPPMDIATGGHLNFRGAQGIYLEELFFHLPFLIAHYLNANQKFREADYWYRRIFDPTVIEVPEPITKTDHNWRYIDFRSSKVPRLREILTDEAAVERYQSDPFNPFGIARLRGVAFQKAVVMKYIDNLLDWGDQLFGQDSFESINEATMIYIMAGDILGDRPQPSGDCETAAESLLTYGNLAIHRREGSEFLLELENFQFTQGYINWDLVNFSDIGRPERVDTDNDEIKPGSGFVALAAINPAFTDLKNLKARVEQAKFNRIIGPVKAKIASAFSAYFIGQRTLAFCVPENETLLSYWDRVDDRLFKIRNCMNLQGVRRELALFQPPIDPGLLVKAKAAGLSLDDITGLINAQPPAYRFIYLLEKAKQFVGTVQGLGNPLQIALEKKDTEDLTLLRAVHEQELLSLVRNIKENAITETTYNKLSLLKGKALVTKRKHYYDDLLSNAVDPSLAINQAEQDSLDKQEDAKRNEEKSSKREQGAAGIHAVPSIGFGFHALEIKMPFNPFAEVPVKTVMDPFNISYSSAHVASALSASAIKFRRESSFKGIEANKAGTRAGHARRKQDWQHQKALAEAEEKQFDEQILAAQIRIDIATKDLESHDKQIEQAVELHEFYKDKFTNLGLYTHLATFLSRLYRESYNLAHDMAVKAQAAYQFEIDDQTFFIQPDNWQADKAGLLAGERLLMQLQRMEKAYMDQNRRDYEITLPCSIVQIDAEAIITLRETGSCDFSIPEEWFDLYYPGQYKRRIKSVRLTVPCIAGPYSNISAKLTLVRSSIRREPQMNSLLIDVPHQRNTSVAASSGNNDAGMFELNFRDERYLPFEGAGAISDWRLELPSTLRPFDYDTISDVILHISYTAKDDGRFKEEVEVALANRFTQLASDGGLIRAFSLRHDFPAALNRLKQPSTTETSAAEISLNRRHFPYFLRRRQIMVERAILILKPNEGAIVDLDALTLSLNGNEGSGWAPFPPDALEGQTTLNANSFSIGQALTQDGITWTITIAQGTAANVEELGLLVAYTIA